MQCLYVLGVQVRAPMPPRFFFVIDVSYVAVTSGALPVICQAIKDSLDTLPGAERTQVGFLTFDSTMHFYNLASRLSQPQMMVGAACLLHCVWERPALMLLALCCTSCLPFRGLQGTVNTLMRSGMVQYEEIQEDSCLLQCITARAALSPSLCPALLFH